ncbi:MAG: hypothetical protein KA746_14650 [Pyrinomonadaceae bacterium]|nr:hypothetical protein [Pyrinomonadaceae bacterium]
MKQSELNKLIKQIAKPLAKTQGWKYSGGFIYKRTDRLFFCLIIGGYAKGKNLYYLFSYKWFDSDDVFWKIVGLEENSLKPLSFRAAGAWTAPTTVLGNGIIPLARLEEDLIRHELVALLEITDAHATMLDGKLQTLGDDLLHLELVQLEHLQVHPNSVRTNHVQIVLDRIMNREYDIALQEIDLRIAEGDFGGFLFGSKTFFTAAKDWLTNTMSVDRTDSPANVQTAPSNSRYTAPSRRPFR